MAIAFRNDAALKQIGETSATPAAQLYGAVYLNRVGEIDRAEHLLQPLTSRPGLGARALLTLGGVHLKRGHLGAASIAYEQAARIALDPVTAAQSIRMHGIIIGLRGDHRRALADLERGFLLTRILHPSHPLRLDFFNSIAVELTELGCPDQARRVLAPAIASPFAKVYPEWRETASDERLCRESGAVRVLLPEVTEETASIIQFPQRWQPAEERRLERQFHAMAVVRRADIPTLDTILALGNADSQHVEACRRLLSRTPKPTTA